MAGFEHILRQRRDMLNNQRDSGWPHTRPGTNNNLGSLALADDNTHSKRQQGTMLWVKEQQQETDTRLAPINQRNGGNDQMIIPADAAWKSSAFAMEPLNTDNNQISSDAPKMEDILIDFGQVLASAPCDTTNMPLTSHLASRETVYTHEAFDASIGWGVARLQSQRDGVPIGPSLNGNGVSINHATRAPPPINPRSKFPPPVTSSNYLEFSTDSINGRRLPVAVDLKPSRRRTSLAIKAEQRASDLEDLTRRTAQTHISPSSARGIWDSLPIESSNDDKEMPLASIPSDPATIVEETAPITSASNDQKKVTPTISVPSDRKLSASIHAAPPAVTPYQCRRRTQHPLDIAVGGKGGKQRDTNSAKLPGATANQSGIASSEQMASVSRQFDMDVLSDGWSISPDVGGESGRDQVGGLPRILPRRSEC